MKMIRLGIVAVLVHLGISLAHGYAHTQLGVGLSTWQNLYVMIVITLAPLIAVFLLWMARGWLGFIVLTVSMAGAFIFGGYYHYVGISPDQVSHLPPGDAQGLFRVTAVLLLVTELFGFIVGLIGLRSTRAT
jgi:hypothetical protein